MALLIFISGMFFLLVAFVCFVCIRQGKNNKQSWELLPKSRTEMIKGIALIGIVLSHLASYSKGMAASGLLRYYNVFCTTLGGIGVNLFFFISGYGNSFSIVRAQKRIKWLWKRIATILIIYFVCFILAIGILLFAGYTISISSLFDNLFHIEIPYSSVWYIKIQVLVYLFLFVCSYIKDRNKKILLLVALCFISAYLFYWLGYDNKWWKSTLCFAIGVVAAEYKTELEAVIEQKKRLMTVLGLILLPISFVAGVLVESFFSMTIGNAILCIIMIYFFIVMRAENAVFMRLGAYSLHAYLIHRSFVAWVLRDGYTTNRKVFLIIIISILGTMIAKWTSDRIIGLCFQNKQINGRK